MQKFSKFTSLSTISVCFLVFSSGQAGARAHKSSLQVSELDSSDLSPNISGAEAFLDQALPFSRLTSPLFSTEKSLNDLGEEVIKPKFSSGSWQDLPGNNSMLPFILPAPDQGGAGSCLYMALTGIAEWHLAFRNSQLSRRGDGPLDLSERALMNVAGIAEEGNGVANWKTDSIYLFNQNSKGVLNKDYRYTKGSYSTDDDGNYVPSEPNDRNASYDQSYNWINELNSNTKRAVAMPKFSRHVIFADPASNQWNVGVAPANIVQLIKDRLDRYSAPVLIIYNHYGYWHAVGIYGYDENTPTNCSFVENSIQYFDSRSKELNREIERENDPAKRKRMLALANKLRDTGLKVDDGYTKAGKCNNKGVFYIRDSIYSDASEAMYDYDLNNQGEEENYSKRVLLRSESFVKHLVNHAVQIMAE